MKLLDNNKIKIIKLESVKQVIVECGNLLIENGLTDQRYTQSMLETYESFGPYMLVLDGVALFHGRFGDGVHKSGLVLIMSNDFLEIEDSEKRLKLCFAFCSKDNVSHMEYIQKFAELLLEEGTVASLLDANTVEQVLEIINKKENI